MDRMVLKSLMEMVLEVQRECKPANQRDGDSSEVRAGTAIVVVDFGSLVNGAGSFLNSPQADSRLVIGW